MKKVKLVIIILALGYLLYFIGSLLYGIISYSQKKRTSNFSYLTKTLSMIPKDSLYFSESLKSNLEIQYSSEYKNLNYLSLYRYKNKYNFIVRKLSDIKTDFNSLFKLTIAQNTTDVLVKYCLEETYPFLYKIDIERPHKPNNDLIINGKDVQVLTHTQDSLLIHGEIFDLSIGKNKGYTNEGFYLQDETFYRKPINTELLLFNREGETYLYIMFPDNHQTIPKGILNRVR